MLVRDVSTLLGVTNFMALSKQQKLDKDPWKHYFCLHERDLLALAGRFEGWLNIAVDLGFTVEKVLAPWKFKDEGRLVRVMTWKEFLGC